MVKKDRVPRAGMHAKSSMEVKCALDPIRSRHHFVMHITRPGGDSAWPYGHLSLTVRSGRRHSKVKICP